MDRVNLYTNEKFINTYENSTQIHKNELGIEKIIIENNIKHISEFILDTIQTHTFLCSALLRRKR
jgi:hypothetical protein